MCPPVPVEALYALWADTQVRPYSGLHDPSSPIRKKHNSYMTRLTTYTIHIISGLLLALLTAGCVADRNVSDCVAEGDEVELEFALKVPALETSLRQLKPEEESAVKSVRVLVFKTDGITDEAQETFAYEAPVTTTNFTPVDGVTRIVCKLKASSKPMRIVCIANHNVPNSILTVGTAKKTILEDAQMKRLFDKNGWKTDGSQPIPMWGESDAQPVKPTTKFNSCTQLAYGNTSQNRHNEGVIHLVRALARVDVGVNFEADPSSEKADGSKTFQIKSVRVYRYATSMYVAGTQATAFNFADGRRKAIPHTPKDTPEGVTAAADANPLEFTAQTAEDAKGYVRNIYIPEIENKDKTKDQRICLVVGGFYKGASKETYYRVDFIRTETNASGKKTIEQLDILRNYRYRFNITKVAGPGTDTPGEALITEPVNIAYDCLVWDDGKIDEIKYDGQYYLIVSKDKFHFGKDAASESYTIRTNWPEGYKIVDKDGNEWPKAATDLEGTDKWAYISPTSSQKLVDKDMTSTVYVLENKSGADRSIPTPEQMNQKDQQQLFVKAGRIWWPLQITQSNKTELDVKVYLKETGNWEADCAKDPINAYTCVPGTEYFFWVKYTEGAKVGRVQVDRDEQFTWHKVSDDPKHGIALYTAVVNQKDVPLDDFWLSEVSKFRVVKGDAQASTDFTLNYMKWDAIPYKDAGFTHNMLDPNREAVYVLGDFNQRFYIRANAPYNLTIDVDNPTNGTNGIEIEPLSGNPVASQVVKNWVQGKLIQEKIQPAFVEGEQVNFQTYDHIGDKDTTTLGNNKIVSALVRLTISPKANKNEPGYFTPRKFTIHFVVGILQPEANTYVIEEGEMPILIPCSQINKAADWWNSHADEMQHVFEQRLKTAAHEQGIPQGVYENYVKQNAESTAQADELIRNKKAVPLPRLEPSDKNWSAHCVWSTIDPKGENSGLERVKAVQIALGGTNYILVQPKAKLEGVAVVSAVRNYGQANSRILWNWTIWVIKKVSKGGHGYPWDNADNGQHTKPYMNRNLGAYRMASEATRGLCYDKFDNDMTGLYYKHGTPVPHHAYEADGKAANTGTPHCSKVWYDTNLVKPKAMQNRMGNKGLVATGQLYGMAAGKDMCSMHDIIKNPTELYARNKESEYILELGTAEWGAYLMKKMWQGGDAPSCLNNEASFSNFTAKTQKTPFDPSPYGWKVPSAGAESLGLCAHPNLRFSRTGGFLAGWYNYMRINTEGNCVVLHVATRAANVDKLLFNYYLFSSRRWTHTDTGGDVGGGNSKTYASTHYPIRCIENEAESDYRDYTVEGVMMNARSATKAARRYHR